MKTETTVKTPVPKKAKQKKAPTPVELEESEDPPIPDELPILPLRGMVLFPGMIAPLVVGRPSSIKLLEARRF